MKMNNNNWNFLDRLLNQQHRRKINKIKILKINKIYVKFKFLHKKYFLIFLHN